MISDYSVSVVIPTYNGGAYLLSAVQSALGQSCPPREVIVIDDGSPGDVAAVLGPVMERIRYIHQQNSGPAAARNHGIRISRGEFIAFLDHDDLWRADNLKEKLEAVRREPGCAMVYSSPDLMDAEGEEIRHERPAAFPSGEVFEDFLLQNRIVTFSATMVRRDVFDTVGLLDERREITCCDDYDLWLRIADRERIIHSADRQVRYRLHSGNLIKNHRTSFRSHFTVFDKALEECATVQRIPRQRLRRIIDSHCYSRYAGYAYNFYYDMNDYAAARELLGKCLRLRPFVIRNWAYFLLCSLPRPVIGAARSLKGKTKKTWDDFRDLSATVRSGWRPE